MVKNDMEFWNEALVKLKKMFYATVSITIP